MYKLIDYFDVWGNETDGYEVNDKIDTILEITKKTHTQSQKIL